MPRFLMSLALLLPMLASAQIYRTTDEQGNVIFTDRPPADTSTSEQVELQKTNRVGPPPDLPSAAPSPATEPEAAAPVATITSPTHEYTVPTGPGDFSVAAQVSPGLKAGQKLQLLLDGSPEGEPQVAGTWQLTNVFRGEHSLVVSVIDKKGQVLSTSEPITVFVLRPSVLFSN